MYQRKDGRWQVAFRGDDGKPKTRSFPGTHQGKKDAAKFEAEVKFHKTHDQPLPFSARDGVHFDELAQEWVNVKKAQGRKVGWLKDWVSLMNKHLLKPLSSRPAAQLTMAEILAAVNERWGGASQTTRNRYIGYISSIFQLGVSSGRLPSNPMATWKKGKESRHKSSLDLEGLRAIKLAAPKHLAWAVEVAWNIPVRPGRDLFSLRFDTHLNHSKGGFDVLHSKVNKMAFIPCKADFLRDVLLRQGVNKSGFLIEYRGQPIRSIKRSLAKAAERAKLPYPVCPYDIRHLWITTMLDSHLEPGVIANLAGTSVRMILKNYYEPDRAEKARAATLLPSLSEDLQTRKVVNLADIKNKK